MLKKIVLGFSVAAGIGTAPAPVMADERCWLLAGCEFDQVEMKWNCPDPIIYLLCDD